MTEYIDLRWVKDGDKYVKSGVYKGKALNIRFGSYQLEISVTRKE